MERSVAQYNLKDLLLSMVEEHGFEQVQQHLREIEHRESIAPSLDRRPEPVHASPATGPRKARPRRTAPQYVARMQISAEKMPLVSELARRFEAKSFLPSFGDVAFFCQCYGIEAPASRSRAGAIPRVFRLVSSLDAAEIRRIIEEGRFSGPSRLGPIADAIRRSGRAAAAAETGRTGHQGSYRG